ncbi:FeoA domain-containing protein [Gleimia sp. 6138-11-ORH1]|nr:FeoA domain-containing protein [Gleimia sp. 6138-11-ORH1]
MPLSSAGGFVGVSVAKLREEAAEGAQTICNLKIARIGEPIQADSLVMQGLAAMGVRPGSEICVTFQKGSADISVELKESKDRKVAILPQEMEAHFFVTR